MRLDICPYQPLHCLQSTLSSGGQGLLACPRRPWPLVPRSISWVNERWDRRALISITMAAPASATLSPSWSLQHAGITASNIVSSKCAQITHNVGDKDWYRGHEVILRYCRWKGQHLKLSNYQLQRSDSYTRTALGWRVIQAGAIAQ